MSSTGNITTKGFDARIGSNTDSFSDVFGQDAGGNYYVKKMDSPRLGIMPIAQDTVGSWPLAGNATITVKGYVLVYIGDTSKPPNYPAYSGNGNGLKIYLTPVDMPLPDSWSATVGRLLREQPKPHGLPPRFISLPQSPRPIPRRSRRCPRPNRRLNWPLEPASTSSLHMATQSP